MKQHIKLHLMQPFIAITYHCHAKSTTWG